MSIKTLLFTICLVIQSIVLLAQDTTKLNTDTSSQVETSDTVAKDTLLSATDTVAVQNPLPTSLNTRQKINLTEPPSIQAFTAKMIERKGSFLLEVVATDTTKNAIDRSITGGYAFTINEEKGQVIQFESGKAVLDKWKEKLPNTIYLEHFNSEQDVVQFYQVQQDTDNQLSTKNIPLWVCLIPPLVAIILALLFREVLTSLFVGIWIGAFILSGLAMESVFSSFFTTLDKYIVSAITDPDHIAVIVFSMLIGGMVAIISKNGGMAGVVHGLSRFANSARSSQLVTWFLGIAIFFDDYANTLIVGNTMRALTDKFRVSREKLAYIVDSTAAPVAAIALITTWIGAELGYIGDAINLLEFKGNPSPYSIFLNSLQYSFYPIFTLLFILFLVVSGRDFGPMLKAEKRARATGKLFAPVVNKDEEDEGEEVPLDGLQPVKNKPHKAINALLPVFTVIIATMVGLIYTGFDATLWNAEVSLFTKMSGIIGNANSYTALMWSSILGVTVAVFCSLAGRILSLQKTMEALMTGFKTMMPAIIILVLAWALAQITKDLHTATYLTALVKGNVAPIWLPVITFLLAGITAFSTGSSWSTMAILYPIVLPTSWAVCQATGMPTELAMAIFYNVTASVLAGSVLGDHCSPISDTTILSSLASNCPHIDHVRTQLPYALTVGTVSAVMIVVSIQFRLPVWANFAIGASVLLLIVLLFGRKATPAKIVEETA